MSSQDSSSNSSFPLTNFAGYPSPLFTQSGLRYPIGALQGGSLIYMAGQPLLPWRPFTATQAPTAISVSQSVQPGSSNMASPLGPVVQLPSYPYLSLTSLFNQQGKEQRSTASLCAKHSNDDASTSPDHISKKAKISMDSASNSFNDIQQPSVIKFVKCNNSSESLHGSAFSLDSSTIHQSNFIDSQAKITSSNTVSTVNSNILLVKCFGSFENSVIDQHNFKVTVLEDLYHNFLSSMPSMTLPYETCVMCTLSYLSSLGEGETICLSLLQFFLQYVRTSETLWLQYYRKHKKMSESTFVQSQFIHFLKLSVQSNTSQVCIIVSQSSLVDGINIAMAGLKKTNFSNCPKIIAVLAVHQSNSIDLCLLVVDKLIAKSLIEYNNTKQTVPSLVIDKDLLLPIHQVQQRLTGKVHFPFNASGFISVISTEDASSMKPSLSHTVEHHPKGPFVNECNVAYYLFQKVVSSDQLEQYQEIDFFLLCSQYPPLMSQLFQDIAQSGLLLTSNNHSPQDVQDSIAKRIVSIQSTAMEDMVKAMKARPNTLFILIVKSAHITCSVMSDFIFGTSHGPLSSSDCKEILECQNFIMLNLSAHPYILQTKYSLVPPSCEIYWPPTTTADKKMEESGFIFQSVLNHCSSDVEEIANVRRDCQFEKLVSSACNKDRLDASIYFIRAQVLLSDYIKALLNSVSTHEFAPALPETQVLVNKLVHMPLNNEHGHGIMVIVRYHCRNIAKDFYSKLKAVRNILGLQYRFEICFDNGHSQLMLSDHFLRRVNMNNNVSNMNNNFGLSYENLYNLPCLIVLSGKLLPSVRMPKSLQYLDLRALHSSNLTRTTYEYDLSHLNRYILYTKQSHCSPALSPLCNNDVSTGSKIVEWKPSYELEASNATFEYNSTDMECSEVSANHKRSIAVVEIPQPVDELADEARVVNTEKVERSLLNDLDDFSDIETEDLEDYTSPATCLLSNQYYHIWKGTHFYSRSHLLLPSDGVIWDPVHNHQPLMDHTYSGQSAYYRNWTKPEGKDLCMTLDSLVKLQVNEVKMRFLLSGPSSVGKLQSCLLFVRLLKDYMRSSQGVLIISQHPLLLPLSKSSTESHVLELSQLKQGGIHDLPINATPSNTMCDNVLMTVPFAVAHSASHSCLKCTTFKTSALPVHTFTSQIYFTETLVEVTWSIPSCHLDSVVLTEEGLLHFIKFSALPTIFSLSFDYQEDALLNISHTASENVHVIITRQSFLEDCEKVWLGNIIAGIPDAVVQGMGSSLEIVKAIASQFYERNIEQTGAEVISQWLLICNDCICMVKDDTDKNIPLCELLPLLCNQYPNHAAIGLPHWCNAETTKVNLSLDANFLIINLQLTNNIHFNPLNYKSAVNDFHFRLLSHGYSVAIPDKYFYVRKKCKEREGFELPSSLQTQPDRLVISLHHDSSSLFDVPGPLLLETFLLHKSVGFFPVSANYPVLMIDNYINLGPNIKVVLLPVERLSECQSISFAGLVLYLCEGRISAEMLQQLEFVSGACLLLVTSDCKGLVKEVSRLDLEEKWQFRLRDEFQTACHDNYHPLFFLTGKFNGKNQ